MKFRIFSIPLYKSTDILNIKERFSSDIISQDLRYLRSSSECILKTCEHIKSSLSNDIDNYLDSSRNAENIILMDRKNITFSNQNKNDPALYDCILYKGFTMTVGIAKEEGYIEPNKVICCPEATEECNIESQLLNCRMS